MDKNHVVLLMGSNHFNRQSLMTQALECVLALLDGCRWSTIVDLADAKGIGNDYLNQVVTGDCDLSLDELTMSLKSIERELGRTPHSKLRGEIEIDIDVVVFNDSVLRPADYSKPYFTIPFSQLQ